MNLKFKPICKPKALQNDKRTQANQWKQLDQLLQNSDKHFKEMTERAEKTIQGAGVKSETFKELLSKIISAIRKNQNLQTLITSKMAVRALGLALTRENLQYSAKVDSQLLKTIDTLRPNPSPLFIRHLLSYYFRQYDQLYELESLAHWLKKATAQRKEFSAFNPELFRTDAAKWLANECKRSKRDFSNQANHLNLKNYEGGRFLFISKNIYYLEQLKTIPVNQPNDLLLELQKTDVFNARYDGSSLLGHEVLKVIISRAPERGVDDSWRNVVMTIAGDPRVPNTDSRYQKWWSQIDQALTQKVIGWLSRFDLRLFLEALEDFSRNSGNPDLKRMFPARKQFLQGLDEKKLITRARLYLTTAFIRYLEKHYKQEHLPEFSKVTTGDKSIIHVQLGNSTHIIEGSHSCKLWIYKALSPEAIVFQYEKRSATYHELTAGLAEKMHKSSKKKHLLIDAVVHKPELTWQNKAITAINKTEVEIHPKDVLTEKDYFAYKRSFPLDT